MKSVATTLLGGLMILGMVSGVAMSKNTSATSFSDGGPVPLCRLSDPNCPSPLPPAAKAKVALPSDGGPVPLCRLSDPNCPSPLPPAAR